MVKWNARRFAVARLFRGAALVVVAVVGAASHAGNGTIYPSPYDNSAADQLLKTYAVRHPDCLEWSDWHKLCSYTGPHGAVFCRTDPEHPAAPSHPFCGEYASSAVPQITDAERASVYRFALPRKGKGFVVYKADRPFNGSTVQEMENPSCKVWGTQREGVDTGSVCSEDHDGRLPLCRDYHLKLDNYSDSSLVCNIFREDFRCPDVVTKTPTSRPRDTKNLGTLTVPPTLLGGPFPVLKGAPVWGLYCSR